MHSISTCNTAPSERRRQAIARLAALVLVGVMLAGAAGCGVRDIDSTYGRRRGNAAESVNGVSVLARMFEQRGAKVSSWGRLSPRLNSADVIIWAPDDFAPPNDKQRKFLEDWLWDQSGRTLVYIGRDYDGAVAYWEQVAAQAPPKDFANFQRKLAKARASHQSARLQMPQESKNRWFTLQRDGARRRATTLSSPVGGWSEGIDPAKTEIVLESRLSVPTEPPADDWQPLPQYEVLLESSGDPLVMRVTDTPWKESKILVVANGSFLVNAGLVNHEHRKLAGRLIDECGSPQRVVFLESGPGEPDVFENEPGAAYTTGLEFLRTWPLWPIALQAIVLGVMICFALFPIFGRPQTRARPSDSDFGRHISALGDLLSRTQDRDYAIARLDHYQQSVRRESGASHVKPRQTPKNSPFDASRTAAAILSSSASSSATPTS